MSHDTEKSDARGIRQIMYRGVLNETLREELRRGENVLVIGRGIGPRGGSCKVTVDLLDGFGPDES